MFISKFDIHGLLFLFSSRNKMILFIKTTVPICWWLILAFYANMVSNILIDIGLGNGLLLSGNKPLFSRATAGLWSIGPLGTTL